MIDGFDYKEPACALCGGKEFYYPNENAPIGRIPTKRIIEKLDDCFNKNDLTEAGRLLRHWQKEAQELKDYFGELSIVNELLGYLRKTGEKEQALLTVERAKFLIEKLANEKSVSFATIYLNAATTLKAFGKAEEAILLYDKAYDIYQSNKEQSKDLFAGYYNNRAVALVDLGKFQEAEQSYFNALKWVEQTENNLLDSAITYINMAHLYDIMQNNDKKTDCIFKAYELLNNEKVVQNGYYAFVLSKCAPSFKYFGYEKIAKHYQLLAEEIYARNRTI